MDDFEKNFETIYHIVSGDTEAEPPFRWVEDASQPGTGFDRAYQDFWTAREHLCQRFGIDFEDDDLELFMNGILTLSRDIAERMFRCGVEYAKGDWKK